MFCIKENWIKVIIYTTNHLWAKNDFVSFGFYYFVEKKFENIGSWSAEFKSNRIDACSFHIFIYHFKNNKQTTTLKKKRKEKWSKKKNKNQPNWFNNNNQLSKSIHLFIYIFNTKLNGDDVGVVVTLTILITMMITCWPHTDLLSMNEKNNLMIDLHLNFLYIYKSSSSLFICVCVCLNTSNKQTQNEWSIHRWCDIDNIKNM